MKNGILIIAAHPDDEVLGCGGTVARLTREGHAVSVAILGEGMTSRSREPNDADTKAVEALRESSKRASALLGVKELFLHGLPDNRFDTVPLLDIVRIIETLIDKLAPSVVFTHHGGDLNVDHVVTHRATLTATRPLGGRCVEKIYAYEVPSSTEWAFGRFMPSFQPNVFVDITATLEKKIEAMELYASEARKFPHPRSPEALRSLANRWGAASGRDAAEAFELIREIQSETR